MGFPECITSHVPLYGIILNSFTALIISLLFSCQVVSTSWQPHGLYVLSFLILHYLPEFASIESVILSNHLFLCHHLVLLPSVFPSIRVFSSELSLHIRWPKYWSFSISVSPSNDNLLNFTYSSIWLYSTSTPKHGKSDHFTVFIDLDFSECHVAGIVQHEAFSDCILPHSNMH